MTRRDLLVVALLTIVTCGLYSFYWSYKTTDELKSVTGKELNPGLAFFEVEESWPLRSDITDTALPAGAGDDLSAQLETPLDAPPAVLGSGTGTRFTGELPAQRRIAQAATADPGWSMTVDGRVFAIDEVLAASKKDDIALIRLRNAADLPHVAIRETIATGDEVFVISHPDGFFHTFTKGYLSRKYLKPQGKVPRLQITADFAKGSSGAGIFNVTGELVGLATATNSIYYSKEDDSPRNLQMVIKSGVPISSIRSWFAEPAKD
jgi:hypothetical protein